MGLALFAFIAIFLLIGSAGLLMFYRAAMMQRLSAAIAPHDGSEELVGRLQTEAGAKNRSRQWSSHSTKCCRRARKRSR